MNAETLFQMVESAEFEAEVNLASTPRVFWSILSASQAFQELLAYLHEDPSNVIRVMQRAKVLVEIDVDPRFANPYDTALAAYVWALTKEEPPLARIAAEIALTANQTWWAREVAEIVLKPLPTLDNTVQTHTTPNGLFSNSERYVVHISKTYSPNTTVISSLFVGLADLTHFIVGRIKVLIETDNEIDESSFDTRFDWPDSPHNRTPRYAFEGQLSPFAIASDWGK